jgi:hypothetical protein
MTMPRMIIRISKQGETEIHVIEAEGAKCKEITENLEEKLGEVVDRRLTAEYYRQSGNIKIVSNKNRR